jgi:hypothetical protein
LIRRSAGQTFAPWPSPALIFGTAMAIAIDQLTEAELIDLKHRIVERLRFLD